jgi:hypothetical protein
MMNETKGKQLAIWGLILQLGFVVGVGGTVIGVMHAFSRMAADGTAQLSDVAPGISTALHSTVAGMLISMVGSVLLLIALLGAKFRAPWFYRTMWVFGILWLINVPIGTVVGIIVIVHLVKHKEEFTEPSTGELFQASA